MINILEILEEIYIRNKDNFIKKYDSCLGVISNYEVMKTKKLKIVRGINKKDRDCWQVVRLKNKNPVIMIDNKKVIRKHGESCYLNKEFKKLSGMDIKLNFEFNYD